MAEALKVLTFSEILFRDGGGGGPGGRKPYHFCALVDYNFFNGNVVHKSEGQAGKQCFQKSGTFRSDLRLAHQPISG